MNHLVVVAHPRADSFTRRVAATYVAALEARGHTVRVRDLYAMQWNPVASAEDLSAMRTGAIAPDVAAEQAHVTWCEVLTFVHPIWWIGLPAILKGWVDRVMLFGFAYRYGADGVEGMLHGRRAVIFTSSGSTQAHFDESGKMASILVAQDLGTMRFCGLEMVEHVHFAPVGTRASPEMIEGYLARVEATVARHF